MADSTSCLFDTSAHNVTVTSDRYLPITHEIAFHDAD